MNRIVIREAKLTDTDQLLALMEVYWQYEQIAGFDAARLRRQQGIGKALLAAARGGLAQHNCVSMQMQVGDDNAGAQHFYARLGFKEKRGYRLWLCALQPKNLASGAPA